MKRGDIYFANLDPTLGSEISKSRPVLIVSCDINNIHANTITILPITSNVTRVFPCEVLLPEKSGLNKPCKAQAQQIRTISKQRIIGKRKGSIDEQSMKKIEKAIKLHLAL